jgi:hypothetical protein
MAVRRDVFLQCPAQWPFSIHRRASDMSFAAILLPVFVLVFLTFGLMVWMGFARGGALKRGEARIPDIALGQNNWPPRVQQISNSYTSQFQLPVLFYILTVLAMFTRHADYLFVVMAWLFVLARLLHVYIHTTSNYVRHRFNAFLVGAIILLVMWVIFALRILLAVQ